MYLPALADCDNLECAPPSIFEGLQAIHRKLLALLEAQGITPFSIIGQRFVSSWHGAVGSVHSTNLGQTIVGEIQRSYRMGDEPLTAQARAGTSCAVSEVAASRDSVPQ
jgi:molecular chaperone GrpE (heat shock protein)